MLHYKYSFLILFLLIFLENFSQEIKTEVPAAVIDSLYREDQFYFGVSVNLFENKPQNFSVNRISPNFTIGFLRDVPFNKKRTKGFGIGLGLTYNKFSTNLVVLETNNQFEYSTSNSISSYKKNKFEQVTIDMPFEIRWRNSTPENHEFFRIYTGLKFSYVFYTKSRFVDTENNITIIGNNDFTKLHTNAYVAFGHNTWNAYISYGFTPLFKSSAKLHNETIGLNPISLGFMFYIL